MITLKNINLSSIDLSGIDLRGIKLGLGGRGGGSGDGSPQLPGDVTRWHFGGLTNEMMAAMDDPRIEDADHKGRFLSFKNFAWGGMSGVNGYVQNFNYFRNNATVDKIRIDEQSSNSIKVTILATVINNAIYIPKNIYQFNKSYFIKISSEGYNEGDLSLLFYALSTSTATTVKVPLNPNGITEIPAIKEDDFLAVYLNVGGKVGSFTVEQLPLYPGFILGDGVDDFAVTEKELNFEDTYTVYTAFIPFQDDPARTMALCGKDRLKDFYMYYSSLNSIGFFSVDKSVSTLLSNGFNLIVCKKTSDKMLIKNLIMGKVAEVSVDDLIYNPGLYYLWRSATIANYSKTAIAGQTICNGYFSTDEDDEKVLDWYKKQYPWLFPDQAWTVVGKTNEDEDRATIANITGNGNNLVLSNFGFAEGSGYGLYKTPFELYPSVQHSSKYSLSFSKFALGDHNLIIAPKQNDLSYDIKVKVTGLKDGVKFKWGWIGTTGYIDITTDGIHMLNKPASQIRQLIVEFAEDFDPDHVVTIEQIPEYEGYLVTDGVDDKVESSLFTLNKDWTIVGNWTMLSNIPSNCGIIKVSSMFLYNSLDGVTIYFMGGPIKIQSKSINAFCSDRRIYLNDWTEILKPDAQIASGGSKSGLNIASYSANFTKMAFKNLAIYDGKNLSKDDCIKAYNYLQTLKAK